MSLTVGSVCSGIGAPEVAWAPLGWDYLWSADIEPFPNAVRAARFQGVPNLGDMTTIAARVLAGEVAAPDVLVGGTPCQSFSVAGLRKGLADDRGNLALEFIRLADAIDAVRRAAGKRPAWVLWENVPGVLSDRGNAFGAFLGGVVGSDAALVPRGRWTDAGVVDGPARCAAWRILDAQFFGLAQRRERVFVLARGGAGAWSAADALLPLIESVRWHPAPRRETGEDASVCPTLRAGGNSTGGDRPPGTDVDTADSVIVAKSLRAQAQASHREDSDNYVIARCVTTGEGKRQDYETTTLIAIDPMPAMTTRTGTGTGRDGMDDYCVAHTLRASYDASEDGCGRGTPLVPTTFPWQLGGTMQMPHDVDLCGTLVKNQTQAVAFDINQAANEQHRPRLIPGDPCGTLSAQNRHGVASSSAVRRLTPRECERLQGFPDDWTLVPYRRGMAADGPRYKALGNSMAVPVMRWIGERIAAVEAGQ